MSQLPVMVHIATALPIALLIASLLVLRHERLA